MSTSRILIVDDNPDLVANLCDVLAHAERAWSITTASSGKEATAIAETRGFDVAIVDVKLPDASGVELIEELHRASPGGEVVLITGYASLDVAIGALRYGAFAFVLKSFRPEELTSLVEQAMTRVRLFREREELERRYRDLVELADVLVVALDADEKIVLFNRKASLLSGVPAEHAVGRSFVESFVPEEEQSALRSAIAEVCLARDDGDVPANREIQTSFFDVSEPTRRPGAKRRVRWHLSRAREEGAVAYAMGVDVTERRALEKRAADAEALSAMGSLALNLAHEIRNPLNAAVLQLHLLGRDFDKLDMAEEKKVSLRRRGNIVHDEIQRLNRLLTEFLELARPRGIAREPVHVGRLVLDVLDLQQGMLQRRDIVVEHEIAQDGCVALGDVEKLKQVVLNLVVNAVEAMKSGGKLALAVHPDGDHVVFEIVDTGPGIPKDVIESVFDPFFTTKEAGTGLGLSIVQKIIDQHAGTIVLESEPGQGTRASVRIPTGR